MPRQFILPDLGEGLEEAEIVAWLVNEGDHVVANQPLVSVETDKAVAEIPSPWTGTIARRFGAKGDLIKVGAALVESAALGEGGAVPAVPVPAFEPPVVIFQPPDITAPAPVGTISLIGRLGQFCAPAGPAIAMRTQHSAMRMNLFTGPAFVS